MKCRDLVREVRKHNERNERVEGLYLDSIRRSQWNQLASLTIREILEVVIDFLNRWGGCRIPKSRKVATQLLKAFRETAPLFRSLKRHRIEDTVLDGIVRVGSERLRFARVIHAIFDRLMAVGSRFSHVAAVKTMHMANPRLFVMWDGGILKDYGYRREPHGWYYANRFLGRMQDEANAAIRDYQQEKRCARETAVRAIEKECGGKKTLAKRLDEYNLIRSRRNRQRKRDKQGRPDKGK